MLKLITSVGILLGMVSPRCTQAMEGQSVLQVTKNKRSYELIALQQYRSVYPDTRDKLIREAESARKIAESVKKIQAQEGEKLHNTPARAAQMKAAGDARAQSILDLLKIN